MLLLSNAKLAPMPAPNTPETEGVRDILRAAKELLLVGGWVQGTSQLAGPDGRIAYCLGGALATAARAGGAPHPQYARAEHLLVHTIREMSCVGDSIVSWNDRSHRTVDEVLAVLDKAILSL